MIVRTTIVRVMRKSVSVGRNNDYKKMEKEKKFTILIEQDEDGIYVAKVPNIQGCYTQGKSVQEVLERIKEAIEVCL